MLFREDSEGPIGITQPTHAWVAGQLARAWGNEQFGAFAPWEPVCLGAEQHDIGWLTWEKLPTLNPQTGRPHSFMEVPTAVHVDLWSGAKQLALPFGRYVALLVSLHGTGLYERYRGWQNSTEDTRLVEGFLEREYAFQSILTASLIDDPYYAPYATPEAIADNQRLVALWDLLSLKLCGGLQEEHQVDNVPTVSNTTTLTLTSVAKTTTQVTVIPWPFQQPCVTLTYEGRRLRQNFTDEAEMRSELERAPWVTMTTTLKPA